MPLEDRACRAAWSLLLLLCFAVFDPAAFALRAAPAKPANAPNAPQAAAPSADLKTTLDKLRVSNAKFVSAEVSVTRVTHNALVNSDDPPQTGKLYVLRDKDHSVQFGLKVNAPALRIVEYKNGVLKDDQPANKKCIAITRQGVDSYVTLGFGGGPDELQRDWNITDLGPETMGGVKVEKLSLIPTDVHVKANFAKVVIWIDLDRDVTLKQLFYASNNDTQTATYSDIAYNKPVKTKAYEIKDEPCR